MAIDPKDLARVADLIRDYWPTEHADHCASVWCEGCEDECTCGMDEVNAARDEALRIVLLTLHLPQW